MRATSAVVLVALLGCGKEDPKEVPVLIEVSGTIIDLQTFGSPAEPLAVSAIDSVAALSGEIRPLASATSGGFGAFTIPEVDVAEQIALVMLTDDAPASGSYSFDAATAPGGTLFPLASPAAGYAETEAQAAEPKEDKDDVQTFSLTNDMVTILSGLPGSSDIATTGFAVGMVINSATMLPLAGATISSGYEGKTLEIAYLPDVDGEPTMTESSGVFLTNDPGLTEPTIAKVNRKELTIVAEAPGFVCAENVGVVSPGVAFMVAMLCEPE